jgi:NAD(P)-dependent dehydrogenase (short-subunit alcohol dehydrogenase family)
MSGARVHLVGRAAREDGGPTVDAVAAELRDAGGDAVGATCDLGDDAAVTDLFDRVGRQDGRIDILVNNAVGWGQAENVWEFVYEPPWNAPDVWWDANFDVGVRSHWLVTRRAAPLMLPHRRGLVAFTSERVPDEPGSQELVMDLRATAVERMALLFSLHLRPHEIASVMLYPGFTRTEAIVDNFEQGHSYFDGWSSDQFYAKTASADYAGRAIASLAADPDLLARTGACVSSYELACAYHFTDVSGQRPDPV